MEGAIDDLKSVAGEEERDNKCLYCWGKLLARAVVAAPVLSMTHCKLPLSGLQKQPALGFLHLLLFTGTGLFHFLWVSPKLINVQQHLCF